MRLVFLLMCFCSASALCAEVRETAHYAIGTTVVPERGILAVHAILVLPPAAAGSETELVLGHSYRIEASDPGPGATLSVEPTDKPWKGLQRILIRYTQANPAPQLRLRYSGPLNPSGDPPLNMITPALTELNLDSLWLPIRSDLNLPFSVEARIGGLPPGSMLVSQGTSAKEGAEFHVRRPAPEIDFAWVASPNFTQLSMDAFEFYARDGRTERAQLYLKHGPRVIAFFESWLGPMPGKPARLVVVNRERVSGYARRGYIVFTEGADTTETRVARFTAHEFGHAYFGNANASSEHRWLDESIAEYVALRYVQSAFGQSDHQTLLDAMREPASKAGPIMSTTRGNPELYDKGPLLLDELEERIGRAHMDRLIRTVAKRKIGRTPDFLAALQELSDAETARWFESRLKF
nr:M1 family aminopeptidase [uncultured Sphingosinicella sp.]